MSWAKFDDRYCWHRKVLAAGNEAVGAHVRMIVYSCAEGTDGAIAAATALLIAGTQGVLDKLVSVALLERTPSGDYEIHDFLDWQPTAAVQRANREADRQRKEVARRGQGRAPNGRITSGRPPAVRADVQTDTDRTDAGSLPVPSPSPSPSPSPDPILRVARTARSSAKETEPDGEHARVIAHYVAAYGRTRAGAKPEIDARDGKRAKELLAKFGFERTLAIIDGWFVETWRAEKTPRLRQIDATAAQAYVPPPPPRRPPADILAHPRKLTDPALVATLDVDTMFGSAGGTK